MQRSAWKNIVVVLFVVALTYAVDVSPAFAENRGCLGRVCNRLIKGWEGVNTYCAKPEVRERVACVGAHAGLVALAKGTGGVAMAKADGMVTIEEREMVSSLVLAGIPFGGGFGWLFGQNEEELRNHLKRD